MSKAKIFVIVIVYALLVFCPAFLEEFAMHNDYSLMFENPGGWLSFVESKHMVLVGRALGGVLMSVQTAMVDAISDFAIFRFVSFLTIVLAGWLMTLFLNKRFQIDPFWCALILFTFLIAPSNQLNVFWVVNYTSGSLNILFAVIVYWMLDCFSSWDVPASERNFKGISIALKILAIIIFVAILFVYPPTALLVFLFTLSYVIFLPGDRADKMRKIFMRDVLFFSLGMGVYRLIDRLVVSPLAMKSGEFSTSSLAGFYDMGTTFNVFSKLQLLKETIFYSAGGVWQQYMHVGGPWIYVVITLVGWMIYLALKNDWTQRLRKIVLFQRIIFIIAIFLIINAPVLIAKSCFTVVGYRVLFPTYMLFILMQFCFFIKADQILKDKYQIRIIRVASVILIFLMGLIGKWNVDHVVKNYTTELSYYQDQVNQAAKEYNGINRFIVVPVRAQATLVDVLLPFEFDFMTTNTTHLKPIFDDVLKEKGLMSKPISLVELNDVVYYDDNNYIIDFYDMIKSPQRPPRNNRARMHVSPIGIGRTTIHWNVSGSNPTFVFNQVIGNKIFNYWSLGARWFEIDYLLQPEKITAYNVIGYAHDAQKRKKPFGWRLQGSNENNQWVDIDVKMDQGELSKHRSNNHKVTRSGYFKKYRLVFFKADPKDAIRIHAIRIDTERAR